MNENNENNDNKENLNKNDEQENIPEKKKKPESSVKRKLKYGSVAMIFTVSFVAVMFLINVVTTAVNNMRPMMLDMTKSQIFGITDASRELLKDITEPIEIIFFQPKDMYEKKVSGGKMIVNCVMTFANEFKNITIREVDIIKTPGIKSEFTASELSKLSTTAVAIRSKGKAKLFASSAFFITYQSTGKYGAFCGERTVTQGILQAVSLDEPIVYFTLGHGEAPPRELTELFASNGFDLRSIDLTRENIDPEAKILVICKPLKDFIGAGNAMEKSEIDKVASFLNSFGSVMYFTDPDVGPLTELDDLLKEYGIAFVHDSVVMDKDKALDPDGYYLSADYYVASNVGDELTSSIRSLPTLPKTIVPYSKPIKILNIASERAVSPVLTSSQSSYIQYGDNSRSAQGVNNLLVVAQKTQYVDNNPKTSLLLVSGSYQYLGLLPSGAYANSDIILNAMRIMTSKKIVVDIKWKEFDTNALSMTMEQQNTWTLICILLLPGVVSLVGVIVWLRRRHS